MNTFKTLINTQEYLVSKQRSFEKSQSTNLYICGHFNIDLLKYK